MHLTVKQLNSRLIKFIIVCMLFVTGCSSAGIENYKLYLRNVINENDEERTFEIDEEFEYSEIVFKLYFTEDSNEWQLVEEYMFDRSNINSFTTGYNYWSSNNILHSDSQLYLLYDNQKFEHTAIELKNYEKIDGYSSVGGYSIQLKELSYDEIPIHMKKLKKTSYMYGDKQTYSIPHNWEKYKLENMKMDNEFYCEGFSCYVYTVQFIR